MQEEQHWFDNSFMPHGHCYFWQPDVLWPNVLGDVLTALAYFSIPILLVMFIKRREDVNLRLIFLAFAGFILACGTTHILAAISVWHPLYYIEGYAKMSTAAISIFTVGLLVNRFSSLLAIPSPAQLQESNQQLLRQIEESRKKQSLLEASEHKFSTIMRNAPIGMALVSPYGRWVEVNKVMCSMFGYSEQEMLQMDFQSITHPEDHGIDIEIMKKFMSGELETAEFEKRYIKKNGEVLYGLVSVQIIRDIEKEKDYFVAQIVDLTSRKEYERNLAEMNQLLERKVRARTSALEEANRDMENFVHVVGHNLQSPLNNMGQMVALVHEELLQEKEVSTSSLKALKLVEDKAAKISILLSDLLKFSRATREELEKRTLDMNALMTEALEELRKDSDRKVQWRIGDLPMAYGDKAAIAEVCKNLLSNALKYTAGEEDAEIIIEGEQKGDVVEYSVKDNGVGFDERYGNQLFALFQRLHTSDKFKGSGVGLAICQRIIKKHNGKIWATGRIGEGACFYFSLPVKR